MFLINVGILYLTVNSMKAGDEPVFTQHCNSSANRVPGSWHVLKHYLSIDGWVTLGISATEAESKLLESGAVPTDCGLGQVNLSVSISPNWE